MMKLSIPPPPITTIQDEDNDVNDGARTPVHRKPRGIDGSASPRKRPRLTTTPLPPASASCCSSSAATFRPPTPPADVSELRRRIAARIPDLDGMEQCPWAQTPGAMLLAVNAAADDTDPTTAMHAVQWLIHAGNKHWFTCGLRTAVCEPGKHVGLLRGMLLANAAQFWPADQLAGSSSSSSSKKKKKLSSSSSSSSFPATRAVIRAMRTHSAAARKRAAVWGPFSAHFVGGIHSDDEEEEGEQQQQQEEAARFCGFCRDDHSPALLMIDALLHGNLAAAQMVAETFTSTTWRISGRWAVAPVAAAADHQKEEMYHHHYVPTSSIRLSAAVVVRATALVAAASRAELEERVRQCMRVAQQTLLPELLEEE